MGPGFFTALIHASVPLGLAYEQNLSEGLRTEHCLFHVTFASRDATTEGKVCKIILVLGVHSRFLTPESLA